MLQIVKQEDKSAYLDIIKAAGLDEGKVNVSEAQELSGTSGYSIYEFTDDSILIHRIEPAGDLVLYDGIARSVMFLAVLKGIEKAAFLTPDNSPAVKLRFIKDESNILEPISQIFNGCADCKHKDHIGG